MKKINILTSVVRNAVLGLGLASALPFSAALAQEQAVDEIIVTGSLIKREDLDSALPIQVFTAADIKRTGVTTAADLMNKLPAMQNFTTPGDSVGGAGGGLQTANLRSIGEQYTLVLLNGRRLAPSTSGSTIDLRSIPLAAVARVEVLTDGASALYGSDAIAGVVNFILKEGVEETTVSARFDSPKGNGGEASSFDITTGFGNLEEDRFNVMLSFSHENKDSLAALDRDFSKTGIIRFNHPGYDQTALFFNGSPNAIPGNATVRFKEGSGREARSFNPYEEANGSCAEYNSKIGDKCFFDYTSTLQIMPESESNTIFINSNFKLTDTITAFAEITYAESEMITKIAPYPTGNVIIPLDSDLVKDYLIPYLSADEIADLDRVTGQWRALPAGNRTTGWDSESGHIVLGLEGETAGIDWSAAIFNSTVEHSETKLDGWLLSQGFGDLVSSGQLNIFTLPADVPQVEIDQLKEKGVFVGHWAKTETSVTGFDLKGSMSLMEMSGGAAQIAAGLDFRRNSYEKSLSQANLDEVLLFYGADAAFDLERDQYGLFAEAFFPVLDNVEINTSLRYDEIGAVSDGINGGDINSDEDDTTYKISLRWDVTEQLTFRGSFGTGFKAPSMTQIGSPLREFGVTSGTYDCPVGASDPKYSNCIEKVDFQPHVYLGGNPELSPETSEQYSVGFVLAGENTNVIVDYWNIQMEDLVDTLTEQQIMGNPDLYYDLYSTWRNPLTGDDEFAILRNFINIAESEAEGIDFRIEQDHEAGFGEWGWSLAGTYMIKSENSLYGSNLGRFGENNDAVSRLVTKLSSFLAHDNFYHNITLNYRSGYADQPQDVTLINDDGSFGDDVSYLGQVGSFVTVDHQSTYMTMEDKLTVTLGVNNLLDRDPPRSLRTGGAGHQLGFDPRYHDPYGRTIYLQASYTF